MNKELIKKYKTEFDHWLNGGKVISKYTLIPTWSNCQSEDIWRIPDKNISKVLIVINDEYATYRKALAEGKIVEVATDYNDVDGYIWKSMEDKEFHYFNINEIRIKPEEPKFKVGDWVVNKTSKQRIVKKITSTYDDAVTVGDTEVGINVMLINDLELWQPKAGDWCWFWDYDNQPAIGKSNGVTPSSENCDFYMGNTSHPYNIPHLFQGFVFCEPYIGQLPSVIKDNK